MADFRTRLAEINARERREASNFSDELEAMRHGLCPRCLAEDVKGGCNIWGLRKYACRCGHKMSEDPFPGRL